MSAHREISGTANAGLFTQPFTQEITLEKVGLETTIERHCRLPVVDKNATAQYENGSDIKEALLIRHSQLILKDMDHIHWGLRNWTHPFHSTVFVYCACLERKTAVMIEVMLLRNFPMSGSC